MTKTLTVAARELRERWLVFPASFVLGFVPFALQALGIGRDDSTVVGLMTAVLLGAGASLVTGFAMFARDASSQRLGFLFAQPIGWPTVWLGKWLGALVAGGAAGLLAALPWMAAYPGPQGRSWFASWDVQSVTFAGALLVIAIGLANLAATAFHSRSAWVILDLAAIIVIVWGARRYLFFLLCGASAWRETLLLTLPALLLLAASAVQLAVGRTDLRRAHRALSLTFWAGMLALLLGAAGYAQWIFAAAPNQALATVVQGTAAGGRWVEVAGASGRSKCFSQSYLFDLEAGAYLPLRRAPALIDSTSTWLPRSALLSFAERAPVAARWVTAADERSAAVERFDLSVSPPRVSRVNLEGTAAPQGDEQLHLSPSGGSAVYVSRTAVSLFDLQSGRSLASTPRPPGFRALHTRFQGETSARVWLGSEAARATLRVLDVRPGAVGSSELALPATPLVLGLNTPGRHLGWFLPTAGGDRIVFFLEGGHRIGDGVELRDGRTGALVATLVEKAAANSGGLGLLADGRIAVAAARQGRTLVFLFDREGRPLREVDIGQAGSVDQLFWEVSPGQLAVGFTRVPGANETVVVDANAGQVVTRIEGLRPAGRGGSDSIGPEPRAGAPLLLRGPDSQVIRLDPASGERRVIAGPGAPKGERISAQ